MIRMLIADDMHEYREHFKSLFEKENDFKVLGTASCENEIIAMAQDKKPDVILMDIQMDRDNSGIIAMEKILETNPGIKIIMLTIHSDRDNIVKAFERGAYDFIEKTLCADELVDSVRKAVSGDSQSNSSKKVNRVMIEEFVKMRKERESILYIISVISRLSATEMDVLKSVINGKKYREIAYERHVEEATIRTIANRICNKVGVRPLSEIVKIMNRNGMTAFFNDLVGNDSP